MKSQIYSGHPASEQKQTKLENWTPLTIVLPEVELLHAQPDLKKHERGLRDNVFIRLTHST